MRLLPVTAAATVLALGATTAVAAPFSYDYLEGGIGEMTDVGDADGISAGIAHSLTPQYGLIGSLGFVDYNAGNGFVLRGGGLLHHPLQKNLDLVATGELVYSDYDVNWPFWGTRSDNDIGIAAGVGLRYAVQDNFQLEGKLTITEVDPYDDGLGILLGARYFIDRKLSLAGGIGSDAEFDGLWLGIRYQVK